MALAVGLGWLAGSAQGAPSYSYVFDQASYTIGQGQTVSVPVYFQESTGSEDVPSMATQNGLAAASVLLQLTSGSGAQITAITPNVLFDGTVNPEPDPSTSSFSVNTASFYATTLDPLLVPDGDPIPTHGILPTETPAGSDIWRVLLGSFSFTAVGNPGDSATYDASMLNPTASDFSTWDAVFGDNPTYATLANDDGLITSAGVSFTITPEPGSLGLLALAGLFLAGRNSAKRRRIK
jgi:hypothetical protein